MLDLLPLKSIHAHGAFEALHALTAVNPSDVLCGRPQSKFCGTASTFVIITLPLLQYLRLGLSPDIVI